MRHPTSVLLFCLVCAVLVMGCAPQEAAAPTGEQQLLLLQNGHVVLGVWPQAGGRIVVLRRPDGRNLLFSDPTRWAAPEKIPPPSPQGNFVPYNGHIVWLGPQSGWWTQQSMNSNRRKRKAVWPPDPFVTYGPYTVKDKTANSVTLVSPKSPVSGVQLAKTYQLQSDGSVHLAYTLTNVRKTAVSWDIWSNTRVPGTQNAYVPMQAKMQDLRVDGKLPLETREGFLLTRGDRAVPSGEKQIAGKVFLYPAQGVIATFGQGICFLKRATMPPAEAVHPDQAFVEVYQSISPKPGASCMELEMHSAYKQIPAGGTHTFAETWQLLPYGGPNTPAAHVAFLKAKGIGVKPKKK